MRNELHDANFEQALIGRHLQPDLPAPRIMPGTQRRNANDFQAPAQECFARLQFRRNQTIFREGEKHAHFYIVVDGVVRLCRYLPNGRRQITGFMFPGDSFGLDLEPTCNDTAEAARDSDVLCYSLPKLVFLVDANRPLQKQLLASLSREIHTVQKHLLTLGQRTAPGRVAHFLVMLSERNGNKPGIPFEIPMSRLDIADYLGLTLETVCRVLSQFKRKRLVAMSRKREIVLKNIDALRVLSGG